MTVPEPRPTSHASNDGPLLPERAFVIQLRVARDGDPELFAGRAEHIASGEATGFDSVTELLAFVRHTLAGQATSAAGEPSGGTDR